MKRFLILSVALFVVFCFGSALAADSQPSAKATAAINHLYAIGSSADSSTWVTSGGWKTIHSNTIKTANYKDLFIDVSLQCGIFTRTKSELVVGGQTSTANGQIKVRVLIDGVESAPALPGEVVFDKRVQTLTAALYEALATDDLGPISNIGYVELILETLQAHAFNFVALNVPAGVHTIAVQAKLETSTSGASATAKGAVGMGSTTIESVRMIKDEVVVID